MLIIYSGDATGILLPVSIAELLSFTGINRLFFSFMAGSSVDVAAYFLLFCQVKVGPAQKIQIHFNSGVKTLLLRRSENSVVVVVCVSPSSAILRQQAFKRKVLNGLSEVRSISGAAVTYFTQPGCEL